MVFAMTAFAGTAIAQCSPNPAFTSPGIYPLPSAPLPDGTVGNPYAEVLTVNVPADTTIDLSSMIGFPVPPVNVVVNSQTIGAITGLPAGITGTPNPASGILSGGASGCIDIAGTPTTSGQYVIQIPTTLNITIPASVPIIGGTNQDIPSPVPYNMEVLGSVAIDGGSISGFSLSQNVPNPAHGETVIKYTVGELSNVALEVMDLQGRTVYQTQADAVIGDQHFRLDLSAFAPGIYLYRLNNGSKSLVNKMVVD